MRNKVAKALRRNATDLIPTIGASAAKKAYKGMKKAYSKKNVVDKQRNPLKFRRDDPED